MPDDFPPVGWAVRLLIALGCSAVALTATAAPAPALTTQPIDDALTIALDGNTRPEANAANDRGLVPDAFRLDHLTLQLRRPPEREAALDRMIDALHDPGSPSYHQWLEPAAIAANYGLAAADLAAISTWLEGHGFAVNFVHADGMAIDFSGTAAELRVAFATELHRLDVAGQSHIANFGNPRIPAALAPAVAGIVALDDFEPQPQYVDACPTRPPILATSCQAIAPADLAVIYNLAPLFAAGITGKGQTIAVVESADPGDLSDWTAFRTTYGLYRYADGTVELVHPQPQSGHANCYDPGPVAGLVESIIDAEWSSAAAPDAHIVVAACRATMGQSGFLTAFINLVEESGPDRPQIISVSQAECEARLGPAQNAALSTAFQTAVASGISVFVATGDFGTAGCEIPAAAPPAPLASHGIAVNGVASTPYNVAVGGTDFGDTLQHDATLYWRSQNNPLGESAKSYVPEIPWNQSCASRLIASDLGFQTTYGSAGLCNQPASKTFNLLVLGGGGGGPSSCATGSAAMPSLVGGTCAGYPRPSWQRGVLGLPENNVRNLPDVALFAASNLWGHEYVDCIALNGGCKPAGGGTSFASPIMAGIQALVNQKIKATKGVGNPDFVYYRLAGLRYSLPGALAACDASNGRFSASDCIFHDITEGDIDQPCDPGTPDCYAPSGADGVLSTSTTAYQPAFRATPGWDFATGLGSVNAANLASAWAALEHSADQN